MTRIGLLEEYLRMARHNMWCVSENMLMSKAKAGHENEFNGYATECEILEGWIAELRGGEGESEGDIEND